MATYLPGVTDYIPQLQPFKPDFNFYSNVLQAKEAQYKAGYQKLSGLYGSLLNSEMLREDNNGRREKFFFDIDNSIKKVAGLDLSKNENVSAAEKIFEPLIDDDYIQTDIAFTKRYRNELSRAEGFKNCTDPDKCGGKWWNGGVQALHYQAQDFTKANIQQTLNMAPPTYTPYVDVYTKAMEFAKEMNFNIKNYVFDGNYRFLEKNGEKLIPSLTDAFVNYIASDPAAIAMYNTQAFLSRKNYIMDNAEQLGSEDAAENQYLTEKINEINETQRKLKADADKAKKETQLIDAVSEQSINETPINEDLDAAYLNMLNAAANQRPEIDGIDAFATNTLAQTENVEALDLDSKRRRVDGAYANQLLYGDMYNAAASYARNTYEQSDFQYDELFLKDYEHQLRLKEKLFEYQLENPPEQEQGGDGGVPIKDPLAGGAVEIDPLEMSNRAVYETDKSYTANLEKASQYFAAQMDGIIKSPNATSEQKELAKKLLSETFGTTQVVEGPPPGAAESEDSWLDWVDSAISTVMPGSMSMGTMLKAAGTAVGITDVPEEQTYTVNGLLKGDGSLANFNNSLTISDPNSPYNRDAILKKLQYYAETNAAGLLRKDSQFSGQLKNLLSPASTARTVASESAKKLRDDNLRIAPTLGTELQGAELYINEDGSVATLEQFRNNFINKYRPGSAQREEGIMYEGAGATGILGTTALGAQMGSVGGPFGTAIGGGLGLLGGLGAAAMSGVFQNDIEDLYTEAADLYREKYKKGDLDYLGVGFRTIDGKVTGLATGSTMFTFDPASNNALKSKVTDLAKKDIIPAMVDRAGKGAVFAFGSIADFTSKDEMPADSQIAADILQNLLTNSLNVKWKNTNDKRPLTNILRSGIVLNDPNKIGVTFSLDEDFIKMYAGSADDPGLTAALKGEKSKAVSVIFDRNSVESTFFKDIVQSELEFLYNTTGQLTFDTYSKEGGNGNIRRGPNGYPIVEMSQVYIDENTGRFQRINLDPVVYDREVDINKLAAQMDTYFYEVAKNNTMQARNR